ncbi:MAG: GNAT family N-acetyltransferase [Desulfovibrio sp.]|nr:GNAT family N-acetyltransferase [Desulfovibrio sp.]
MEQREIGAFGVELKPLAREDLPLLCHWRNQEDVLPFMDVPHKTSLENLTFWYNKIQAYHTTVAWIVHAQEAPVAYTELKDIRIPEKSCEGGIFLFGKRQYGTGLSSRIVLAREIMMRRLGLDTLYSRIRAGNGRGLAFCQKYGGEYTGEKQGMLVYVHKKQRRLEMLGALAEKLGLAPEFASLLAP